MKMETPRGSGGGTVSSNAALHRLQSDHAVLYIFHATGTTPWMSGTSTPHWSDHCALHAFQESGELPEISVIVETSRGLKRPTAGIKRSVKHEAINRLTWQ